MSPLAQRNLKDKTEKKKSVNPLPAISFPDGLVFVVIIIIMLTRIDYISNSSLLLLDTSQTISGKNNMLIKKVFSSN